jgi:undecaprenyl-diphosphatase
MGSERERGFWARRWARDEWLGLSLTLGLLACLLLLGFFSILAVAANGPQPPAVDQWVYENLRLHREASPAWRGLFLHLTDLGGLWFLTKFVVVVAVLLAWKRRFGLALVWVLAVFLGLQLNSRTKLLFERARPLGTDAQVHEPSYSFPSGHSMEAMIAYGMLGYLLLVTLPPRRWTRRVAIPALAVLVLAVGFSRMYLSAHWFTDVLGGFALGAAWLALCITFLECGRRRSKISDSRWLKMSAGQP